MDYNKTEAMMDVDDGEADSGIASNDSNSRRDSLSSMASSASSSNVSNDSAFGSMSDRRSSTSSNYNSRSGMSNLSLSSRTSGYISTGHPGSVSSSLRSSLPSVRSDDSTTTIRSDVTATSMQSGRNRPSTTSQLEQKQSFGHAIQSTTGTYSRSGPSETKLHTMDDDKTESMIAVDDVDEDSGIASNESDSRRDSFSSMASSASSSNFSNDSAFGSMSDRRSSTSSNFSTTSGKSNLSLSSRTSGYNSAGYPDSASSSRRSSLSSVQSDDSTTTIRSDVTVTSTKSGRNQPSKTSLLEQQQGFGHVGQTTSMTNSRSEMVSSDSGIWTESPSSSGQGTGSLKGGNNHRNIQLDALPKQDMMDVFLRPESQSYKDDKTAVTIQIRPDQTVSDLQKIVQRVTRVHPSQQYLIHESTGTVLSDRTMATRTIGSCNITHRSWMKYGARTRGGGGSVC